MSAPAVAKVSIDKAPPVITGMPAGCKVPTNNNGSGNFGKFGNLVQIATVSVADLLSGLAPG